MLYLQCERGTIPSFLLPLIDENTITELLEDRLGEGPYFLVNVSVKPGNRIEVTMDGDEGLPIEKCVEISRFLESELDRDSEDFSLQVMSAGLTNPLVLPRQFKKNIGREVKYVQTDGRAGEAELKDVQEDAIVLLSRKKVRQEGKKKKVLIEEEKTFKYSELKEVRVKLAF